MNVHVPYTQAGRMMAIATSLGEDSLLLEHLSIDEAINRLFVIEAEVKSQRDDLQAGDLIGSSVDFSLKLRDDGTRWWNGFVTDLHEGSLTTRGTRSYALTLRPKLWTLSQKSDCRIFRGTTSPQIVETLCKEHGITDLDMRITGKPTPQDYSVQWNETDLAYMLRRVEEDGLFYWFVHKQGKHTLVVADHASGYDTSSEPQVRFTEGSPAQDYISQWRRSFAFTSGKRTGRDWNFLSMSTPEATQPSFATVPGNGQAELYEFPGRFADTTGAEQMTKNRIQATETGFETVEGVSTVRTLGPAQKFTPQDVAKPSNTFAQQVVTAIRHEATDRTYETNAGVPTYGNTFDVMPATTPATPHRMIRRPKIIGSQIALIAGPSGEEIFTDQFGRVKVWFPWDRRAKKDGSDTCWMRVGQPWAGTTWGHQVIPRVGMECLISYQEGDPDRPFVTALVPDPTNPVPYTLPDNKTKMVFRSKSYKSSGNNEMSFEDATGSENMFFHAQKDHTTKIENNQTTSIGASLSKVVGQNEALTVGANQTEEIGGSANLTVGGTGAGAAALMAPLLGMAGETAGMLTQALQIAGSGGDGSDGAGASGDATSASSATGGLGSVATALGGMASGVGGGGFGGGLLGTAMGAADAAGAGGDGIMSTMMPQLGSSLVGLLGGSGLQAQNLVGNGPNPLQDGGTALAAAGAALGVAAGGLFSMGGVLNTTVGLLRTDSIGMAHAMQVGTSQVINVGATSYEQVGQAKKLLVGSEYLVQVGKSMLFMNSDGTIILKGVNIYLDADTHIQLLTEVADVN